MQETIGAESKARIIYVGDEESRNALTLSFADNGYELVSVEDKGYGDIGLIDLRGRQVSSRKARTIAALLRKSSPDSSILLIIDCYLNETARKALRRHGELVTVLTSPDGLIERCRQILRLRNIAEETGERLKTLATLSRLNEFPAISAPASPLKVLIAGEPSPLALTVLNSLQSVTEQCVCVFSAGQALRAIETAEFDAAVFLPKSDSDPLMSLVRSLRRHPKHSGMPIIFPLEDPDQTATYVLRGAMDFLLASQIASDLASKIQISAKRSRLLKTMRRFLQACEGDSVRDPSSGAFTATFLAEHGARVCARADQTGRSLALVALRIETESKGHGEPEPGKRALHQAVRLINRVTRAEDIVARIAPDIFLLLMPATTGKNAEKAALRIKGVLENTVFRSANDDLLYGIHVGLAACARPEGHCIEESVALALAVLRENAEIPVTEVL
ncbi:GGDEF domain-containing protein [Hyphococcus sp.]|uniref:GGDEF domain-containing protein n=1 Tax=Hyphococcus sp. TaxID=2038636 RepID=UPI0037536EF0